MSETETSYSYDYDEEAAGHAEDFVNRIEAGPFEGVFTNVWDITAEKGSKGVHFEFEAGGAKGSFDIYTIGPKGSTDKNGVVREQDTKFPGYNQLMAIMTVLGVRSLKTRKGAIEVYDKEQNKRVEASGNVYPDLMNKKIGVVFQKEVYNRQSDGKEAARYNFLGSFNVETRLTASEMREGVRKADPEKGKLARMVKGNKVKDSRTVKAEEPAQPSQALPDGAY